MDPSDPKKINFKDNLTYYLLLAFCVLLPFQFALNPALDIDLAIVRVIIPLLFLGWLFFTIRDKQKISIFDPLSVLFVLYLFLAIFSVFFAQELFWSLRKLLFLFSIAPFFFIAKNILDTPQKQLRAVLALVCGATILAFLAIVQFFSQFIFGINSVYDFLASSIAPFFLGQNFSKAVAAYPSWLVNAGGITYMRATAVFPDPHMLSYYLGILIPWSVVFWATAKKNKLWLGTATIFLILADVFTFTRGGYIALIAGGIIVLPLVSKKVAIKIILGAAVFIFLLIIMPNNPVGDRLVSSFDVQEGSNIARLSNFQQAIAIIKSNPLGVGIGNYSLAVNPSATYREPIYAHNLYLDTAAELGVPAAVVLIILLFFALKYFWLAAKTNPSYIAGVSSITIFAIHSLVENPFYSVHVFPLFLIILAISSAIHSHEKNSHN